MKAAFLLLIISIEVTAAGLPYELIGTIIRPDQQMSIATVYRGRPDSRENYHLNGEIDGAARVQKIERQKLTVLNLKTKEIEIIRTPPFDSSKSIKPGFTKSAKTGSYEFNLSRKEVDKLLEKISDIIMDAGTAPVQGPNGITGFKLTYLKPGSIYEKIGLSIGDEFQDVNGTPITSPTGALELFNQLRDSSYIKLKVKRGNSIIDLVYLIR